MKSRLTILFMAIIFSVFPAAMPSCETEETDCGTYNGHALFEGPRGGCYYYNSNNNKTYVDRSYCNCK